MAGNDGYTVLLLPGDGVDESQDIIDSSIGGAGSPHTMTAVGNTQIDTAQKVYGTGSILFDANDDAVTASNSVDWTLSDDLAFDCRFRTANNTQNQCIINHWEDMDNRFGFIYLTTNNLQFKIIGATVTLLDMSRAWTPTNNVWYHLAVTRSSGTWRIFVDGVQLGATASYSGWPDIAGLLYIGNYGNLSGDMNGHLDEIRLSKGIARWTSNFTPPTEAYSEVSENYLFYPHIGAAQTVIPFDVQKIGENTLPV